MTPRPPGPLNRTLLTLFALALLAVGGLGLARSLGSWPAQPAHTPLLSERGLATISGLWWIPYIVIGAAAAVGLLATAWLAAQLPRRSEPAQILLVNDAAGRVHIDQDTLTRPLEEEIETFHGVTSARARLTGQPTHDPALNLTITTNPRADLAAVREQIHTEAAPHFASTIEVDHPIPTQLLFRTTRTPHSPTLVR